MTTSRVHQDELDALLLPLIREASVLSPRRSDLAGGAGLEAKFGGVPYAESGDVWPRCPTCEQDLSFVMQFRKPASGDLLVFFYCFGCFPWGLSDEAEGQWVVRRYAEPSPERLVVLSPARGQEMAVEPCAVSESTVRSLPDWDGLSSASRKASDLCGEIDADSPWDAYQAAVVRNGCLDDYATQVGGYPRWVQGEARAACRECRGPMAFVAQVDSEQEAGLMWGDVGLVYLFQCPAHPDVFHLELQCH